MVRLAPVGAARTRGSSLLIARGREAVASPDASNCAFHRVVKAALSEDVTELAAKQGPLGSPRDDDDRLVAAVCARGMRIHAMAVGTTSRMLSNDTPGKPMSGRPFGRSPKVATPS